MSWEHIRWKIAWWIMPEEKKRDIYDMRAAYMSLIVQLGDQALQTLWLTLTNKDDGQSEVIRLTKEREVIN